MAFDVKVFCVLIASTGGVGEERGSAPEIVNEWNTVFAAQAISILMLVRWESHAAPLLVNRLNGSQIATGQLAQDRP